MIHYINAGATPEFPIELASLSMRLVSFIAQFIAKPSRLLTDTEQPRERSRA
jgi:hypothetical protein